MSHRLGTASLIALCLVGAGMAAIAQDTPAAPPATASPAQPVMPPVDAATPATQAAPAQPATPPSPDTPVTPVTEERPIEEVFRLRCRTCHADEGTGSGPSLKGVFNRKIAAIEGFNYSPAMKAKGGTWDEAALNAYIERPTRYIPGTKMFTATPVPEQRAKMLEYIKTY